MLYDYDMCCLELPKTLYLFTELPRANEVEDAAYQALTKILPPNVKLVLKPIYILYPNAVYSGTEVGMYVTLDGFLTANLVSVPYADFDMSLVPLDNIL